MELKKIESGIGRLAELAEGWRTHEAIDPLERDLALEILRGLYSGLRFERATAPEAAPEEEAEKIIPATAEAAVADKPEPEPTEEEIAAPAEEEPVSEPEPLPAPEPAPRAEEIPAMPRKVDPQVIRSLYGDSSAPKEPCLKKEEALSAPKVSAKKEEEPAGSVPAATLGDVINSGRQTLGETLQNGKKDMASKIAAAGNTNLRQAIGLNDKFLMIRDMFDGDADAFTLAIARLDRFTDLDEAIIYIHDTYNWSADSEGVKLLVELLERKLG